ncbi:MAG TPA: hypothetical protein G4O03_08785 [Dehalococcoidia bacterium]|nr:hypothetical protein [Dehalococcoidia bacterium]
MAKCSECGFLTMRDKTNGLLVEAIDDYRISGNVPTYLEDYERYYNYPICFTMAYDLLPEVEEAARKQFFDKSEDWGKYVLGVITKERECPPKGKALGFTKYQQGFTPKEHREMLDREEWRDWQERQRKADRHWRIIEIVLLAIISGGFVVLGALIGRGYIP